MVIVDTTVWIDYLGGRDTPEVEWLESHAQIERLGMLDIILCEVLQGIQEDRRFIETRDELLQYKIFATGGLELGILAAENYRKLRKKGIAVRKTTDCWIATYCLLRGHGLLHRDRDFEPFEEEFGLKVVKPSEA